jgi:oligopeptide transport system permease protein
MTAAAPGLRAAREISIDRDILERPRYRYGKDILRRFSRNRLSLIAAIYITILIVSAIGAPLLTAYGRDAADFDHTRSAPSLVHWLGTDQLGRDFLTRVIYGARISLGVAFAGSMTSMLVGVVFGAISGYAGGRVDDLMMRFVDLMYGFPTLLFIILLMIVIPPNSDPTVLLMGMFIALGLVSWLGVSRVIRGQFLSLREQDFVEAARAAGASPGRIIWRHMLPNSIGPVIVMLTLDIPSLILAEATLSFIGLGVPAPVPSWGRMLSDGWRAMRTYPHMAIVPAAAITITMLAFNFFGDGLRDAFDPMMRGRD